MCMPPYFTRPPGRGGARGREKVNKHVTPIQSGSFQFLRRRVELPVEMFVKDMELINP